MMQIINNPVLLKDYIQRYQLNIFFEEKNYHFLSLIEYTKYEPVLKIGDRLHYFYFLVNGKLKVTTTLENGKSLLLRFYSPLNVLGDVELTRAYPVMCDVNTVSSSQLIRIPLLDLERICGTNAVFLRFIIHNLSHKLFTLSRSSSINQLYPLQKRLASYLLSMSLDNHDQVISDELKTGTLVETAQLLGTSYRHLNRIIARFIESGIVSKNKGKVKIRQWQRLKELARGVEYE